MRRGGPHQFHSPIDGALLPLSIVRGYRPEAAPDCEQVAQGSPLSLTATCSPLSIPAALSAPPCPTPTASPRAVAIGGKNQYLTARKGGHA